MLDAPIVPKSDRMRRPPETHLKLFAGGMLDQEIEHRLTLVLWQIVDMRREVAVDEQGFALADRMGAHDRVRCFRKGLVAVIAPGEPCSNSMTGKR